METKSRYEVVADFEQRKRSLLEQKNNIHEEVRNKEKRIKLMKRELEDAEEELQNFKDDIPKNENTIDALIKSVDDALSQMQNFNQSPGK